MANDSLSVPVWPFSVDLQRRGGLKWIPDAQRVKVDLRGDFKTADGRKVSLRDLKSKVTFLNFWAPWCEPCKEEMPAMDRLYAQFHQHGLEMIALTSSPRREVQKFLARQPFAFTVAFDPGDSLATRFTTQVVPTTIILDANGRVALRHDGVFNWDAAEAVDALRKLLGPRSD